ncbi:calmodulin isoform X1 [Neodiprion pinetum]|uniref:Calmodulin isoform X1 n=2 Tax=Neodiprion lecontei TaxID=441921 RepID=A0ABM3FQ80_NEOLC|nr:calmodulin-like isoform X1 [Neodiprion fabricii]XP_046416911.1 calmodulin-like isoform X1 [Neodiprion fabricii]XP_046472779.1 calmodulin-like isoform X1 [Neodiprion pinetum]XP_046472780.1 calmodulin-like isoform X1 [Neodiprion pinetum]XP_046590166.1 calmodulin isoform X1 [Neodiprion lecontei]XP_046590167.1 calmodulin isoform X1 [Neodiprion lecontei]XP_046610695.1 calmodulin-like isoform X1 [Neodiprion virginianus]
MTRQTSGVVGGSAGDEVAGGPSKLPMISSSSMQIASPEETLDSYALPLPLPVPVTTVPGNVSFPTSNTPSTPSGATRLPANLLFALPATPQRSASATKSHHEKGPRSTITKAQMKEFREAFRLFDKDGDGSITKEELGRVMRSLGQFARAEELQTMLQEIDIDGDGNVSFEEFVEIVSNMGGTSAEEATEDQEEKELRDAFRVFDKHNRGYITASDLRAVLQCLGEDLSEEEIEDMIKEVDVDGDGRIDFYEFVHALGEPGIDEDEEDEEDEPQSPAD